jgi:hypothetical protein
MGTGEDAAKIETEPFDEVLVEHAVRCWDSERENANRLSSRGTLLLSALAALFGLGLFRIDWFRGEKDVSRISSLTAIWAIKILMSLGLVMFGLAFFQIMGRSSSRKKQSRANASDYLSLPQSIITKGPPAGDEARKLVFVRIYRAFSDLQVRNSLRKKSLDLGQQLFLIGLALIAISILVYIFASEPL